ncbi:MAG TPA: DUF1646 family protein [Elusimicrobiota bacterium]|nr:DUF1646 family protein [Elusimicrobiota bacterium]
MLPSWGDQCGYTFSCAGGLFLLALLAFLGPLADKRIAARLEWFLLALGAAACTFSMAWSEALLAEALLRPLKVCSAILSGALVFSFIHDWVRARVRAASASLGPAAAVAAAVLVACAASLLLTAPVAGLILVEILEAMRLKAGARTHAAVLGCLAIGLASTLSPLGGPIPAIAMAKMAQAPYLVDGRYLLELAAPWALPMVLGLSVTAGFVFGRPDPKAEKEADDPLTLWNVLVLTGKLYVFIAGLVLLGGGLLPLVDRAALGAAPGALFWGNSLAAVADGATLAAVEISPRMHQEQLRAILLSLPAAGGALVQGNAHNLLVAQRLRIQPKEWAKAGVPAAAALMACAYFSLVFAAR